MSTNPVSNTSTQRDVQALYQERQSQLAQSGKAAKARHASDSAKEIPATVVNLSPRLTSPPEFKNKIASPAPPARHDTMPPEFKNKVASPALPAPHDTMPPEFKGTVAPPTPPAPHETMPPEFKPKMTAPMPDLTSPPKFAK